MDFNNNKVISDVMARGGVTALLIAKAGSGKTEFLAKLSTNYKKVFWFNPQLDDFENLALCIARKLFRTDPVKINKIEQIIYCRNPYNNDDVIINHIIDFISYDKNDYLFIFEQMEYLPNDYNFSKLERLMKRCPNNLKIIVSSERFINFDFRVFEQRWPMLIDERALVEIRNNSALDLFFRTLDKDELQFLRNYCELLVIDADYVESVFPKARKLLQNLKKHSGALCETDEGIFKPTSTLRQYVQQHIDLPVTINKQELAQHYADYCYAHGKFIRALRFYYNIHDAAAFSRTMESIITDRLSVDMLARIAGYYPSIFTPEEEDKYVYCQFYKALELFATKQYDDALVKIDLICSKCEKGDSLYVTASCLELFILFLQGKYLEEFEQQKQKELWLFSGANEHEAEDALCTTIKCMIAADIPFEVSKLLKYERIYCNEKDKNCIWYVKLREIFSRAYACLGNYRRALEILDEIKEILPFYLVPHNMVSLQFFVNHDIEVTRRKINKALELAEQNDISLDISLLYAALARVKNYVGLPQECLQLYDKAVSLDSANTRTKFRNIAERALFYARLGDLGYATEYANTYLKYTETYAPRYTFMLHSAVACCQYLLGDYDAAYASAMACVKQSKAKSIFWLISMAVAASYLMRKHSMENPTGFVENLLKTTETYGMDMMIVEHYDIFSQIIDFAKNNGIQKEYVEKLISLHGEKDKTRAADATVKVCLFGTTTVYKDNKEIVWKTKKSKELFIHYILAGQAGLDRQFIIDLMWNNYQYESAINNLKTTNNIIRKTLEASRISFKLEYLNSKYALTIDNCTVDVDLCKKQLEIALAEQNVHKKAIIAERIIKQFGKSIAIDMNYPKTESLDKEIKRSKIILLIRTVKGLIRENDCVEAHKFLDWLMELDDEGDYTALKHEIDLRLGQL